MTFTDLNREMVSNFLHSAVIIDDQIVWSTLPTTGTIEEETILEEPDEFGAEEETHVEDAAPLKSNIEAKPIIKSFSDCGIVCSPYSWDTQGDNFPNSSDKADLLILDWKLEQDGVEKGNYAKNFIEQRLKKDLQSKKRLRFISIYTSEKTDDVLKALKDHLANIPNVNLIEHNDYLDILSKQNHKMCRIKALSKSISEEQLANEVIKDFLDFVGGFLPNILLSAIAETRNKTYEYLAEYHNGLDLAIISHYTALKSSSETFDTAEMQFREYVSNLVASSIKNSLSFSGYVKKASSKPAIINHLKEQESLSLCTKGTPYNNKAKILKILRSKTFEDLKTQVQNESLSLKKPLFLNNEGNESYLELSALDLLSRTYLQKETFPPLKLGTILQRQEDFYLCIQPLCDGLRLDSKNKNGYTFPFLKLSKSEDNKFNLVVPFEDRYLKLKYEAKPRNIESFTFIARKRTSDIRGVKPGKATYPIFADKNGRKFNWLGELENVYAQEILNLLAHQGSRVGSDKFEWLRKQC